MVASMRPGSVIVDVSVDQGGCVETTRPTSHSHPVYVEEGVTHYAVTNMPGAVPHTSTIALTNATLPYARSLARWGTLEAARRDPALALGINPTPGASSTRASPRRWGSRRCRWRTCLSLSSCRSRHA